MIGNTHRARCTNHSTTSLLAREINWLETSYPPRQTGNVSPAPYSLGKLIDWKHKFKKLFGNIVWRSLLAREINWLETRSQSWPVTSPCAHSLLAREINWLETRQQRLFRVPKSRNLSPYSLGKLIDWKLLFLHLLGDYSQCFVTPYSLGKLIDWKPLVRYSNSQVSWRTLPTR